MDIVAGITTFNPNLDRLKLNIEAVSIQVSKLIIIDNGSTNFDDLSLLVRRISPNSLIISNKKNKGVAFALNQILAESRKLLFEWVLLLDQDSIVQVDMIKLMSIYIADDVAIISPFIVDKNRDYADLDIMADVEDFLWPITSGSLVNLNVAVSLGGFQEDLFVDFVDDEFSIRVLLAGYKSLRVNKARLNHEIGHLVPVGLPFPHYEDGSIVFRRAFSSGHSPLRHYYQVRNLTVLHKCYGKALRRFGIRLPSVCKFIAHSLIFEQNRKTNLLMMLEGLLDSRQIDLNDTLKGSLH